MSRGPGEHRPRAMRIALGLHGPVIATMLIAARMGCQALVLIGVARLMGAHGYGQFAAVVALASVIGPLCGLGADFVALRATAEDATRARKVFDSTLRLIVVSGLPLVGLTWLIAHAVFAEHAGLFLVIGVLIADLLLMRVTELAAKIFQGDSQVFEMGLVRLMPASFRLVAVGGLRVMATDVTPTLWASCYLVASALAAAMSVVFVYRRYPACPSADGFAHRWRDGLHFAGGVVSVRVHTEADKALVLSLSDATGAGIYAAAYRLIEFALVPVAGLVAATYGRLFAQAHRDGRERVTSTALRSALASLTLGSVVGVAIWIALGPLMRWTVGPEFAGVEDGRYALAMLPIAMSLRMTGEQSIAALGALWTRTRLQWSMAPVALLANVFVIPEAGWVGSAWVCVMVESVLGLSYLALIVHQRRMTVGQ